MQQGNDWHPYWWNVKQLIPLGPGATYGSYHCVDFYSKTLLIVRSDYGTLTNTFYLRQSKLTEYN